MAATTDDDTLCCEQQREAIHLTPEEQKAYDAARTALHAPPDGFCGPVPSLVSMDNDDLKGEGEPRSILHHRDTALFHSTLEQLTQYEKQEAQLPPPSFLVSLLAEHQDSLTLLQGHRRVCQHPFKKNDIVWVCRTCQADETCVLCHACFSQSDHAGHDVAFYHAQAGGCCDCGDPEAWDPAGFCPRHGPHATPAATISSDLVQRVKGIIPACIDWLVENVAATATTAYERTTSSSASTFVPEAASMKLSASNKDKTDAAEELGLMGTDGLFIVLHADEIHPVAVVVEALKEFLGTTYYADHPITTTVKYLRQYGQLIVYGTSELIVDCGLTQVQLWRDGDRVAAGRIGSTLLNKARILQKHGVFCSILTRTELMMEQRAVTVLQWISTVARSCDPLCRTVAETILPHRHLTPLLRSDFVTSARVTKTWYSLLLTLLAVPTFKSHLAAAYCDTYQAVTAQYARGMGVLERSGYTLSVQFLNRVTYVIDLVQKQDLLGKLGKSLLETLRVATTNGRVDPNHFVLTFRRYSPCVSDLKCVLNVSGMPRVIAAHEGTFLADWLAALRLTQWMDTQVWRLHGQGHVVEESRGWVGAFNASISLGSLFERLLGWADDEPSPIATGPLSRKLRPCADLTVFVLLHGVASWQDEDRAVYSSTRYTSSLEPHCRAPASLGFATVAAANGTVLAMAQLPVAQVSPFSFHLPLHRFAAGCLRELCLRPNNGLDHLLFKLDEQLSPDAHDTLFRGLMEYPLLVLSRAAQVRAGLWRRNGPGLNDQVLNYAEPPFCRNMRDADLLMVQFATLGRIRNQSPSTAATSTVGMAFLSNLALHRFGIFEFVGLIQASTPNPALYMEQVATGLYPPEKSALEVEDDDVTLPWTYSPSMSTPTSMLLLEEFLHFMVMFVSELPSEIPVGKQEQTEQAKGRLYREVVHRLASGPKTHSELSEVHHVLSHWDNLLLSEEGKLVNPDDATGAALGSVLDSVASRKSSRGRMEPDKWELNRPCWDAYDPAFFHCSLRNHQIAAEGRPKPPSNASAPFGWESRPYAPPFSHAHPSFSRLRRDAAADATILAVIYRVFHIHCRSNTQRSTIGLPGNDIYTGNQISETALSRALHFITLGAFSWSETVVGEAGWRRHGGGSVGSLFYGFDDAAGPNASSWVRKFLLADPSVLVGSEWYAGEECLLILLQKLAVSGGTEGLFVAHDSALRAGAAWICEFALKHCPEACIISPIKQVVPDEEAIQQKHSDVEERKRQAKLKAMARMKAQAEKFAKTMEVDLLGSEEEMSVNNSNPDSVSTPGAPLNLAQPTRKSSFGSAISSNASSHLGAGDEGDPPNFVNVGDIEVEKTVPMRLLHDRPRCIICNGDDECRLTEKPEEEGESLRKRSRRRTENALGLVGFVQPSLILKGGGGPPSDSGSPGSTVRDHVGTYVALCGHAVHSECCESYLASVSHREDRHVGKREEFRCPLCQRLSNCLVPFIDVGVDWIESSDSEDLPFGMKSDQDQIEETETWRRTTIHDYLTSTPWWVAKRVESVQWDGRSSFVEGVHELGDKSLAPKPARIRSLRKKDLYAAWNSVMRTPRLVRKRLRRQNSRSSQDKATPPTSLRYLPLLEESVGETVVWRRLMDQISDVGYRADGKRLGDEHLHNKLGEFRHYMVEKYSYNQSNSIGRSSANEATDWPSCLFGRAISEDRRQEMSREKLLSKLLLSVQAFAYTVCCEAFEARRCFRKCSTNPEFASRQQDTALSALLLRFGISDVAFDSHVVVMPVASSGGEGGANVFDGRLGRVRYLGLATMVAAGAIASDLIQLVLPFPAPTKHSDPNEMDRDSPDRAPIAFPILLGNVLTHVTAALCASSGRARARSDSLEVLLPLSLIPGGNVSGPRDSQGESTSNVISDCEGFLELGVLARVTQVLCGSLKLELLGRNKANCVLSHFDRCIEGGGRQGCSVATWLNTCKKLVEIVLSESDPIVPVNTDGKETDMADSIELACETAASEACLFLAEASTIVQILVPGFAVRFHEREKPEVVSESSSSVLDTLMEYMRLDPISSMLESDLVKDVIVNWVDAALRHLRLAASNGDDPKSLRGQLYNTQGFRLHDWPSAGTTENTNIAPLKSSKLVSKNEDPDSEMLEVESVVHRAAPADLRLALASPTLLTFRSRKSVPLLGGFKPLLYAGDNRPRVAVVPTSYTDLYAELGQLLPECEQTAVCLVCGEVLDASGKGECTRHSFKCGAGAGMFFLLQECSGLIMHKNKAAYIHSPYVDSHGETPQYRGRPLNLDLERYEHLREVWFNHGVRQKVVAERVGTRQMIVPDFY